MNVEIKREAGCWSVFVNGVRMVDRESYQVASNIEAALRDPSSAPWSESFEVAESIRKWVAKGQS